MPITPASIKKAAKAAFGAVSGLLKSATFTTVTVSHNTATGAVTETTSTYTVRMLRSTYSKNEVDNVRVFSTDVQGLTLVDDITFTLKPESTKVTLDSIVYHIIGMPAIDPANAVYTFQLRAM